MNITDLIVEFLNQGHIVELPGIGTLSNEHQSAHMDDNTHTFHAERNDIQFSGATNGNTDIVKRLAEMECVDMKIAQMMWNNYIDALRDKLDRTGSHQFPGIGELCLTNGSYRFNGEKTASDDDVAIADVKRYDNDHSDPFAAFDTPVTEEPKQQTEPKTEPEPAVTKDETTTATTEHPESSEMPAEPEPVTEPDPQTAPQPDPIAIFTQPVSTEGEVTHQDIFSNMKEDSASDESRKSHGGLWLILILLLLLLAAGGYYYYTHYYQPTAAGTEKTDADKTDIDSNTPANTKENDTAIENEDATTAETHPNPAAMKEFDYMQMANIFTFNTDLLEYSAAELATNRTIILNNMREYWLQYLSARHYAHAMPYLQEEIAQYADRRLTDLLDDKGYSVQRFFNCDDYLHRYFYNELKSRKALHSRVLIQSELMDYPMLDDMLRRVVEQYGLTASDVGKAATKPAKATAAQPKPVIYTAHVETSSKQGFDIIAGFYTSRQTAARQAARLKDLGCDAYIIDQNQLYYVSMGSAPTRTAAEALYKQITSWYAGSVAIKQW